MTADQRAALEEQLRAVETEIGVAYWAFTRTKRGGPVPGRLYDRKNEILLALGRARCSCGAVATTREGGRDRCGPCTATRLRDVAAQARALAHELAPDLVARSGA